MCFFSYVLNVFCCFVSLVFLSSLGCFLLLVVSVSCCAMFCSLFGVSFVVVRVVPIVH